MNRRSILATAMVLAGHLPGAVLVPRGLLEFKLSGTPALSGRDLKVVLY